MIYCKFDWYSAMWQFCSLSQLFGYYGDMFGIMDHWSEFYNEYQLCFDCFVIKCGDVGIQIRIDRNSVVQAFGTSDESDLRQIPADTVLQTRFSRIKVDISGSGLDFYRDNGIDIDSKLRTPPDWLGAKSDMHITRLDVAFDFIDQNANVLYYLKEFLDDPLRIIDMTCSNRVLSGDNQSKKFTVHWGSERTIYIGSPASDQLLRLYDKKFQYEVRDQYDTDHVPYRSERDPEALPDSWIRFELQLRNYKAQSILYSDLDYYEILKYLYDQFKFRTERQGGVLKAWQDVFQWDRIKSCIVQSVHFVQSNKTPIEKIPEFINFYLKTLALMCATFPCGHLDLQVADILNNLRRSSRDHDLKRYRAILNYICMGHNRYEEPERLWTAKNGDIYFSDKERKDL